jgi:hypothetical protein
VLSSYGKGVYTVKNDQILRQGGQDFKHPVYVQPFRLLNKEARKLGFQMFYTYEDGAVSIMLRPLDPLTARKVGMMANDPECSVIVCHTRVLPGQDPIVVATEDTAQKALSMAREVHE